MTLLSLTGIGKRFENGTAALAGASLSIKRGEFVSLLGPSGCGKSTLLRIIAGLADPSEGAQEWPEGRPETAFVFQEATLMPWARVIANVALPLRLEGVPHAARNARAEAALAAVGLSGFGRAFPRELSGGMKMRASLARAMTTDPQLLLLDEPFAALDEMSREGLNDALLALWREKNFTAVFVTHSVAESVFLSTRILVMSPRPGRIVATFNNRDPFPRPADYRANPSYTVLCREVRDALRASAEART